MFPFGAAPLHIAVPIRLVGDLADAPRRGLEPYPCDLGGDDLLVDAAAHHRVEVPGFGHHLLSDSLTQLTEK